MSTRYFYGDAEQNEQGPYSADQMRTMARNGQLSLATPVYRSGDGEWFTLEHFQELTKTRAKGKVFPVFAGVLLALIVLGGIVGSVRVASAVVSDRLNAWHESIAGWNDAIKLARLTGDDTLIRDGLERKRAAFLGKPFGLALSKGEQWDFDDTKSKIADLDRYAAAKRELAAQMATAGQAKRDRLSKLAAITEPKVGMLVYDREGQKLGTITREVADQYVIVEADAEHHQTLPIADLKARYWTTGL